LLESQISNSESAIKDHDARLNDYSIIRDAQAAAEIYKEKSALEEELLILYDTWAELNEEV